MKSLVKYTVYFWYEDDFWDNPKNDEFGDGMRYFIEEHNCHGNFINDLARSMDLAGDDICNAGVAEVVTTWPKDIYPYEITKEKAKND